MPVIHRLNVLRTSIVVLPLIGGLGDFAQAAAVAARKGAPVVPTVCTMEFAPVCARRPGGPRSTYANPCMARRASARILRSSACEVEAPLRQAAPKLDEACSGNLHEKKSNGKRAGGKKLFGGIFNNYICSDDIRVVGKVALTPIKF